MSRSTLRRALRAGALCLTATTTAAVVPAAADAAQVGVSAKRLNIQAGSRVTVKGRVAAPGTVKTADPAARPLGDARPRPHRRRRPLRAAQARARRRSARARACAPARVAKRTIGRLNVYRRALASWYGPGLFGNKLGCGGTLGYGTVGVANKTPAVRDEGDAAPPRPRRARARDRPRARTSAGASTTSPPRPRASWASAATGRSRSRAKANVRRPGPLLPSEGGPEARHRPPRLRRVLRHGRAAQAARS